MLVTRLAGRSGVGEEGGSGRLDPFWGSVSRLWHGKVATAILLYAAEPSPNCNVGRVRLTGYDENRRNELMYVGELVREREEVHVQVNGAVWWSSRGQTAAVDKVALAMPAAPVSGVRALYARLAREYDAMPQLPHYAHDPLGEIDPS